MGNVQPFSNLHVALRAACVIFSLCICQVARSVDTTWIFDGNGNWNETAKWSNGEPINDEYFVTIDEGASPVTVTLNQSRTIGGLVLGVDDTLRFEPTSFGSTSLTSANGITSNGAIVVGGSGSGAVNLVVNDGALAIGATGQLYFQSISPSFGTRTFSGNLVNEGAVFINRSTTFSKFDGFYENHGEFTIASGQTLTVAGGDVGQVDGTLNINGILQFNNGGTLQLTGGAVKVAGSLNLSADNNLTVPSGANLHVTGAINLPNESTLVHNGGVTQFGSSALISGGKYHFLSGTMSGTATLDNTALKIGPAATGPADFVLLRNSTLEFSGQRLAAGQTITFKNTLNVDNSFTIPTGFTNDGTVRLTSTTSSGIWLQVSAGEIINCSSGLLHFAAAGGSKHYRGDLVNHGTVVVDQWTNFLKPAGHYINHGQVLIAAGKALNIEGAGILDQVAGTLEIDGELSILAGGPRCFPRL